MLNPRAWPQQLMLEEVCKQMQHCCATLRRSQNKRNLGTCWLKRLLANKVASVCTRSKGWRSGESARLPPCNVARVQIVGVDAIMWVEFTPRGFSSGTPLFLSPQKPTSPNSESTRNQVDDGQLCGCATSKSLFIYLTFRGLAPSVVANLFCFQYSDTALYTQLLYFSRLFDFDHAVKNAKTGQYFE